MVQNGVTELMNSPLRWTLTIFRYYKHLRAAQNPVPGPNPPDLGTQLWAQHLLTRGTGCPSLPSRPTSQHRPDVEVQAYMVMQKLLKNSGKQYQQVFKLLRKQVSAGVLIFFLWVFGCYPGGPNNLLMVLLLSNPDEASTAGRLQTIPQYSYSYDRLLSIQIVT